MPSDVAPHGIQCALDLREAWLAEHGPRSDLHQLAEQIHTHCGHARFKALRLAHGWRRVEDAVTEFHAWTEVQGLSRTGMDVRSWRNWEAGSRPGPSYLDLLSRFLSSNAVWMGFAPDYSAGAAPPARSLATADSATALSPEELVASCAIEAARRGAQLDTPVGAYTIDELTAAMYEVADAYPYSPVLPSLLRARELRDQAWRLQERCQRPNQLRDLHHIAGWLCAILANASFDLGSTASAQTHARVADLHGELIDDHGLRAWVAGLHALIAYWDGRPHDCVAYAESARRFHPTRGTTLVRAASIHARGLALLRRHDDVDAALHEAERLRDNAGEDLPGVIAFPHAKQLYWASSAHLGLGLSERAQAAENAAASAITLYEADPPQLRRDGELGHARLDYVTARLAGDEFDGIAEEVNTVLVSMRQRRIESVMRRLRQLTTVLQKPALRSNRHLREVHEAIDADLRYSPPIAALPTGDTAL